jgi:hypothetical protein
MLEVVITSMHFPLTLLQEPSHDLRIVPSDSTGVNEKANQSFETNQIDIFTPFPQILLQVIEVKIQQRAGRLLRQQVGFHKLLYGMRMLFNHFQA